MHVYTRVWCDKQNLPEGVYTVEINDRSKHVRTVTDCADVIGG